MKLPLIVCAAALLGGCIQPRAPAQQAQDAAAAIACLRNDWGKPVATIAGDCFNSVAQVAEDAIADAEAIAEGTALLAGQDVGKVQASFPYASDPVIVTLVQTKRAQFLKAQGAPAGAAK